MPLPERLKPMKVNRAKISEMTELLQRITKKIDSGATESDAELNSMMMNWNAQVVIPHEFSDFRDYSSWISAKEFTRSAFNQVKYISDLTYSELVSVIDFICNAEGKESEHSYTLDLLEVNFDANPSDLIYWPNLWFNNEEVDDLSPEEMAAYLMKKANRHLPDSPPVELKYPVPESVSD
ncbi:conserved protein of unknown function [Xenorhabdus poinarii G6]|uniref:Uncharacterized protein n=1 Tax=Xenorhabdus poinarii G6 TaxID=1354304 RepID=A0A068R2Y1_9GAMM|nr:hypothetical protein [Xenorhabdus poinarii]CDG21632.1 conserved protein of unknown function [Xenorhabdus poinarii G6]